MKQGEVYVVEEEVRITDGINPVNDNARNVVVFDGSYRRTVGKFRRKFDAEAFAKWYRVTFKDILSSIATATDPKRCQEYFEQLVNEPPAPAMTPVTSSNIAAVGWTLGTLQVQFKSGSVYAYADVPEEIYDSMMSEAATGSVGSYFHQNIKEHYVCQKVQSSTSDHQE